MSLKTLLRRVKPGRVVDRDEFAGLIKMICEAHPDRHNPTTHDSQRGEVCAYRMGEQSCLIGHVLINHLGFKYNKTWELRPAPDLMRDLGFDYPTRQLAGNVQSIADTWDTYPATTGSRVPWSWGWVLDEARRTHLI